MGFRIDNDQHRQRISISPQTMTVLEQDVSDFHLNGLGDLVNAILSYIEKHNLTKENELLQYRQETAAHLEKFGISTTKDDILEKLCAGRRSEIIEKISQNRTHKRGNIGKNIYIKQSVLRWLESEDNTENEYYDGSLLLYLNCILEEYSNKDLYTRETIAMDEQISRLSTYIRDQRWIDIYWPDGHSLRIFPVRIMPDKLSTHTYLACFRHDGKDIIPVSFRISSLPDDMRIVHSNTPVISEVDLENIEQLIKERRVDFLTYEPVDIKVRMTPPGVRSYTRTARLRPDIIWSEPMENGDFICTFHCSLQQATYYFVSFGKEVEILEPKSLRTEFKKMFTQALSLYK